MLLQLISHSLNRLLQLLVWKCSFDPMLGETLPLKGCLKFMGEFHGNDVVVIIDSATVFW